MCMSLLPACCVARVPSVHGSQKRASDALELGSQTAASHHVGARNQPRGSLEEQPVLLTTEPSLQPQIRIYCM